MKYFSKLGQTVRLMLATMVLAALTGCDASGQKVVEAERDAAANRKNAQDALTDQGAKLQFTESGNAFGIRSCVVDLTGVQGITDETIALLGQLPGGVLGPTVVAGIDLSGTSITDEQLGRLSEKLPGLMKLNLRNTAISDAGLQRIAGLTSLNELDLTNTKVTAGGVEAFLKSRADNPDVKAKKPKIKR
ncbi:MAG: hypothetical protein ACT4QC_20595 [Planctomycetaceae bacterium]